MDEIWAANPELNILMLPQLFCGREYALNDVELFRDLAKAKMIAASSLLQTVIAAIFSKHLSVMQNM